MKLRYQPISATTPSPSHTPLKLRTRPTVATLSLDWSIFFLRHEIRVPNALRRRRVVGDSPVELFGDRPAGRWGGVLLAAPKWTDQRGMRADWTEWLAWDVDHRMHLDWPSGHCHLRCCLLRRVLLCTVRELILL